MHVDRIELSQLRANHERKIYTGQLQIFMSDGPGGQTQTTNLNCRTLMLDVESRDEIREGLVRDAIRQMQWMPEVRFGTVSLRDLPDAVEVDRTCSAA